MYLCRGADCVLSKRLKNHLRKEIILKEPSPPWDLFNSVQTNPYALDYLLVLDFEATCVEVNPPDFIHEVIEFPVLMLNIKTLTVVSSYRVYMDNGHVEWGHSTVQAYQCLLSTGGSVSHLLQTISKSNFV